MILKIEPEFRNLLPPLSKDEGSLLEKSIREENGCRNAIIVWKGLIIDGHKRYVICRKYDIPYKVEKMSFPSKRDAKIWIVNNQLARRNLTNAERIGLARRLYEIQREKGKLFIGEAEQTASAVTDTVNARKEIAKIAGVSETTVQKYMKVVKSGDTDLVDKVENGDVKISAAYKVLHQRKVETILEGSKNGNGVNLCDTALSHILKLRKMYRFIKEALSAEAPSAGCSSIKKYSKSIWMRLCGF